MKILRSYFCTPKTPDSTPNENPSWYFAFIQTFSPKRPLSGFHFGICGLCYEPLVHLLLPSQNKSSWWSSQSVPIFVGFRGLCHEVSQFFFLWQNQKDKDCTGFLSCVSRIYYLGEVLFKCSNSLAEQYCSCSSSRPHWKTKSLDGLPKVFPSLRD